MDNGHGIDSDKVSDTGKDNGLAQPARRDFLTTGAAALGAFGLPTIANAAPAAQTASTAGEGRRPTFRPPRTSS
jgi:hypothetical protein